MGLEAGDGGGVLAALAEGALDDALDGSDGGGLIVIEEGEDLGAEGGVVGEFGEAGGAGVGRGWGAAGAATGAAWIGVASWTAANEEGDEEDEKSHGREH